METARDRQPSTSQVQRRVYDLSKETKSLLKKLEGETEKAKQERTLLEDALAKWQEENDALLKAQQKVQEKLPEDELGAWGFRTSL